MADLKPNEVVIPLARLAFADLVEPRSSVAGAEPKYGVNLLIDPETKEGKKAIKAIEAMQKYCEMEEFKKTGVKYKEDRCCFVDGDDCTHSETGEVYTGFEGMKVLKAKSKKKPKILNRAKELIGPEDEQFPYSGCYVDGLVRGYCVSGADKGGNGFFAQIEAVRFRRDGESFGGSISVETAQAAFEDDDEDDDGI